VHLVRLSAASQDSIALPEQAYSEEQLNDNCSQTSRSIRLSYQPAFITMWTTEAIIACVTLIATCAPLALYLVHRFKRRNDAKGFESGTLIPHVNALLSPNNLTCQQQMQILN
jgi:hypothetical protein